MNDSRQFVQTRPRLLPTFLMAATVCFGFGAAGQSSSDLGKYGRLWDKSELCREHICAKCAE